MAEGFLDVPLLGVNGVLTAPPDKQENSVRECHKSRLAAGLLLFALFASASACAQGCAAGAAAPLNLTLVTFRILQSSLTPVPATDGFIHLAYAAQLTNINKSNTLVQSIVPVDPASSFEPSGTNQVVDQKGNDVTGKVYPLRGFPRAAASTPAVPESPSSMCATAGRQDVPRSLSHRLLVKANDQQQATVETTAPDSSRLRAGCHPLAAAHRPTLVEQQRMLRDRRPASRRLVLPVNGAIQPPEQFAIDFEQLTPAQNCCTGPIADLNSYPFGARCWPRPTASPSK